MKFTANDLQQLQEKGISQEQVAQQIAQFTNGVPFAHLTAAARVGNGILQLDEATQQHLVRVFKKQQNEQSIIKFVPASGAATRMFKFLFEFVNEFDPASDIDSYISRKNATELSAFVKGISKFPFYEEVIAHIDNFAALNKSEQLYQFVQTLLFDKEFDFGNAPKGLLPFHRYSQQSLTAFAEHLYEGITYAKSNQQVQLHFTISENHQEKFSAELAKQQPKIAEEKDIRFVVDFSYQKSSTDTIAVTPENEPYRNPDGSLLFRPSGHGALISNLNQLRADVIFIKNIDNIVVQHYHPTIAHYKMVLAGLLVELQESVFAYQKLLDTTTLIPEKIEEIHQFMTERLYVVFPTNFRNLSTSEQADYIRKQLFRPLRICGMVKNEGEPGGGPFWVQDENGTVSLQIVETSQIDTNNATQLHILQHATHFNPVDLVCGIKNYKGDCYNLHDFVNPQASFISNKTVHGTAIKALEVPGLWNGAMAYWNTIFVEVPLVTFNPVKTVNDLLKEPHQHK